MTLGNFFYSSTGAAAGYQIEQSLRFNSADSAYLNRTPSSAGNRKTWTWSGWVKRTTTTISVLSSCYSASNDNGNIDFGFRGDDQSFFVVGWTTTWRRTTQVFRDPSAWYHIVLVVDTTQATAANRLKVYVNGTEVTSFSTSNNPSQNADLGYNQASTTRIGSSSNAVGNLFNGYLAEVNFIDGSALDPTDFGELDDNGVWRPIEYAGSYTGNSFYLKFASGDGTDSSGLSNTWTANNFTTSGTGTDVMDDTPTTNWCTLNPLDRLSTAASLANGNLDVTTSAGSGVKGTCAMLDGKYYFETTVGSTGSNIWVGIRNTINTQHYLYAQSGLKSDISTSSSYGASTTTGDVIGVAFDSSAGSLVFYKNGTSQGTAFTGISSNDTWVPFFFTNPSVSTAWVFNFGQRAFAYTPPTGFKALNTSNLPAPEIADGSDYFNTVLWSGDGVSGRAITGVGFQPDFLWIKRRNASVSHYLQNSIAGATYYMFSDDQIYERNLDDSVDSFDTDGFTLGNDSGTNGSGGTYVGWNWLAGGSVSADNNTDGSITSTVSANPSAGFSIVTWNGSTANDTVGHGLGVEPSLIIFKRRNATTSWPVYHSTISPSNVVYLNETAAQASSGNSFGSTPTAPTSSVFSVGDKGDTNYGDMLAYCFAEVEGYSKFGSYTGNGNPDGPFVFCGFKPRWIMLKKTNTSTIYTSWSIYDTARDSYNVSDAPLYANVADQEGTNSQGTVESGHNVDILSNGFKLRDSNQIRNTSGDTYIFAAFAENPFGGTGVSPATAR